MKRVIIVGAGRFGYAAANRLSELGAQVTVLDVNEKRLSSLRTLVSETLVMNAIDREALKAGISRGDFDVGVVAIGDDFSTDILVSLYLKEFGVPYIVARASNPRQGVILRKIGVDLVITPEDDMGHRLAEKLILAKSEQIDLSPDTSVVRIIAPEGLIDKTIAELELDGKGFNFLFVARRYTDQGFIKMAFPDETEFKIAQGDYLLFAGDTRRIASFVESVR